MYPLKVWEIKFKSGVTRIISGIDFNKAIIAAGLYPFLVKDVISIVQTK